MSEFDKALGDIDSETYIYTAGSFLVPLHKRERTMDSDIFTDAGIGTVFVGHRQAIRESSVAEEVGEEGIEFVLFGGSIACLTILHLPNADEILRCLEGTSADDFADAIRSSSLDATNGDQTDISAMAVYVHTKSEALANLPSLCGVFASRNGYEDYIGAAIAGGAGIFNFGLADIG
jgi:hypothetical protein